MTDLASDAGTDTTKGVEPGDLKIAGSAGMSYTSPQMGVTEKSPGEAAANRQIATTARSIVRRAILEICR